ncbi:MAG TPA: 50S ribosomal protein L2, partial [Bacteroidales bacterium]|nr:50S ribosomal protein L2 [Bacteroidales bacterium]
MALKKFKPTTPGQRYKLISAFDDITTNTPEKSLLESQRKSGRRNN